MTTPPARPQRAFGRSLADFPDRSVAEERLLDACRRGVSYEAGTTRPDVDDAPERHVRAGFVRFLALGGDDEAPVHEQGVMLSGAWLEGPLDLNGVKAAVSIDLIACRIEAVDATLCTIPHLSFNGSLLERGLSAIALACTSRLDLSNGFRANGPVCLNNATLGELDCSKGRFADDGGLALQADDIKVAGNMFLKDDFHATGEVRLLGGDLGLLVCSHGRFENPGGDALSCDRVSVSGGVFLVDARIHGAVRLPGAMIGGGLFCGDARIDSPGNVALQMSRARIAGDTALTGAFHALGEVSLIGTSFGGNLQCTGGRFENAGEDALSGDAISVTGDVMLNDGFRAIGSVRLVGATIGGDLVCRGGRFFRCGGHAISGFGMRIGGNGFFDGSFAALGTVHLPAAVIGGNFYGNDGRFLNRRLVALHADGARIERSFAFASAKVKGEVNLAGAHVRRLDDGAGKGWPGKSLRLDGFTYDRIASGSATDAAMRIAWLDNQLPAHVGDDFRPQPWEHLVAVLRAMGNPADARAVAIAKQDRIAGTGQLRGPRLLLHQLYGGLIGYGYRPTRMAMLMIVAWLACSFAYWLAVNPQSRLSPVHTHLIVPVKPDPVKLPDYENFVAPIYSADVLLPVVKLGYASEWTIAVPARGADRRWGQALRFVYWGEILFGWISGLLLVGVLGNLVKKD